MLVHFKHAWFAPGGRRFRKNQTHEVPEEFRDLLPAGTKILDVPEEPEEVLDPQEAFKAALRDEGQRDSNETNAVHAAQNAAAEADKAKKRGKKGK
jgi:hypothetical protein